MAKKVIGIKFGVLGGASISGESGKLIKEQLQKIANQTQLKITINETHFSKQLDKLKKDIQKKLGTLEVGFKTKDPKSTIGSSGNNKQSNTDYKKALLYEKQLSQISEKQFKLSKTRSKAERDKAAALHREIESKSKLVVLSEDERKKLGAEVELLKEKRHYQEAIFKAGKIDKMPTAEVNYFKAVDNANRIANEVSPLLNQNPRAIELIEELRALANKPFDVDNYDDAVDKTNTLKKKTIEVSAELRKLQGENDTFGNKVRNAFDSGVVQKFAAVALAAVANGIRLLIQNVVNLDKAIVNLQIASGLSRERCKELVEEYANLAQKLGATTMEVADAADTWLRQGYAIEEVNELIVNTMMLSKLGQMEAAEASKALTSAMKGYKLEVEDAMSVVDKFTAVDMVAATTAGDIATAMAETAASANIASISMDKLIGYITTVSEVTQDGAESVGTFYKTLFARMGNIKVGKFVDADGEDLNDVEKILENVGIKLRDETTNQFRDFGTVLDEVGAAWKNYDNTQQHAIATAFAGTRQQEKFIVLMENYGEALKYAATAAESAGTAQEKYSAYTEGVEASIEAMKGAWEEFSMAVMDSKILAVGADILRFIINILDGLMGIGDGALLWIPLITAGLAVIYATSKQIVGLALWKDISAFFTGAINGIRALIPALGAQKTALHGVDAAQKAVNASNPYGWIMLAVGAIWLLVSAIDSAKKKNEEAIQKEHENNQKLIADWRAIKTQYEEMNTLHEQYIERIKSGNTNNQTFYDIESAIVERLGDKATALEGLTQGTEEYTAAVKKMSEQELSSFYQTNLLARGAAEKEMNSEAARVGKVSIETETAKAKRASELTDAYSEIVEAYHKTGQTQGLHHIETDGGIGELLDAAGLVDYFSTEKVEDHLGTATNGVEYTLTKWFLKSTGEGNLADYNYYQEAANGLWNAFLNEKDVDKKQQYYELWAAVKTEIDRVSSYYTDYIESNENIGLVESLLYGDIEVHKKTFLDIYNAIVDEYDVLKDGIEEMSEGGLLSGDTISKLLGNDFIALRQWLEKEGLLFMTPEGYKLNKNALNLYKEFLETGDYAGEIETFTAVWATLLGAEDVQTQLDLLEAQKDVLEEQKDKFKDLIEIRKDLLKSYKDEIDYQKELAAKQEKVADIRTKLSLAMLDDSAAGRARVRELEKELEDAEDDLNDFTLEHAIEQLIVKMDDEYSEYEKMIDKQVNKIVAAIDKLKNDPEKKDEPETEIIIQSSGGGNPNKGITPNINRDNIEIRAYHSGGFVGDYSSLRSNEVFAKLMDGEFVSTPSMIKNFLTRTLPTISKDTKNSSVVYNAPLVSIECETVTEESLPSLEEIVDGAVKKIKKEIDSAFSRTGFRKEY